MDGIDDLDDLVKIEFDKLYSEFDNEQRKYINPQSIKNIIYYLIENPQINPKKNQKLQELGEIRMKKKLLEYFKALRNTELDMQSGYDLYVRYFMKIGEFMSEYYGFSGNGGKNFMTTVLIILTIGIIIDTTLFSLNLIYFPLFSILFFTLWITRRIIKYSSRRQYGLFY
tara:strand:- start:3002 stop:3511 length:510 start_codon:yes stop_codon:yes gene_type:complete